MEAKCIIRFLFFSCFTWKFEVANETSGDEKMWSKKKNKQNNSDLAFELTCCGCAMNVGPKKKFCCYVFRICLGCLKSISAYHTHIHITHTHTWDIDGIISSYTHTTHSDIRKKFLRAKFIISLDIHVYSVLARHWHIFSGLLPQIIFVFHMTSATTTTKTVMVEIEERKKRPKWMW